MSVRILLRDDPDEPVPESFDGLLLDLFGPGSHESTVHLARGFFGGEVRVPEPHSWLFELAAAVYVTDKSVLRAEGPDGWERALKLSVPKPPGRNPAAVRKSIEETLRFLTGDHWTLELRTRGCSLALQHRMERDYDGVCLFSGGLDSLTGAIDLLEKDHTLALVGHHDAPTAPKCQRQLAEVLAEEYGETRLRLYQLQLRPAPANNEQVRPLPDDDPETTTRSRSLLFIAAGLTVAAACGSTTPLFVPENGFIGLNVPLTPSRQGSLSTRTTHPHFMRLLQTALDQLDIHNPIHNPFRQQAKGEVLTTCANMELLKKVAPSTVSCSHPEAARWVGRNQGDCGYCYPCLIRRAAMYRAGWDDSSDYAWDVLDNADVLDSSTDRGSDLRALLDRLAKPPHLTDPARNGPLPSEEAVNYRHTYLEGRAELLDWLSTSHKAELVQRMQAR